MQPLSDEMPGAYIPYLVIRAQREDAPSLGEGNLVLGEPQHFAVSLERGQLLFLRLNAIIVSSVPKKTGILPGENNICQEGGEST